MLLLKLYSHEVSIYLKVIKINNDIIKVKNHKCDKLKVVFVSVILLKSFSKV